MVFSDKVNLKILQKYEIFKHISRYRCSFPSDGSRSTVDVNVNKMLGHHFYPFQKMTDEIFLKTEKPHSEQLLVYWCLPLETQRFLSLHKFHANEF